MRIVSVRAVTPMEGYTMNANHAASAVDSKPNGATVVPVAATPVSQVPVQPTYEQLKAQLAALQAQMNNPQALTLKVSAKGAVSVYGLGKWPLTLYRSTFERVLDAADQIRAFIAAHPELSVKEKASK